MIRWFESPALDKPELRSPQPCKRGIHCDYKLTDEASGTLVRACCSGVHPGEEGTGRRLFPARTLDDGREQPACVRLTGASQGFYERRRLRMSWAEWCEKHDIPFTPALPGQPFEPLVRAPLGWPALPGQPLQPLVRAPLGGKKPDATIQAAMELCQSYMRERHPMQEHASIGGSTAFGLNPRAFDVMAQQHAERSLDPRMMSRGFLGMPGGAEAARIASGGGSAQQHADRSLDPRMMSRGFLGMPGGAEAARIASGGGSTQPQAEQRSKAALKNARKRANKKAGAAEAAAAKAAAAAAAQPQPYIHSRACLEHSGQRPLAWGPEPEGGCLCAGISATIAHNRAVAAGLATPQAPGRLSLSDGGSAEKWAVYSRGGECSPDCCCPMGVSCHDRILPPDSADTVPEQEDEAGFASPKLTRALASKGDFENLD